jgi:DNA-binding CsgD family transcriptional regulator/methyl-accepting chemotaxis protein
MGRYILMLFMLSVSIGIQASNIDFDSIYHVLDDEILRYPDYVARYERKLSLLTSDYYRAEDIRERYQDSYRLYEAYKPFVNDSSIFYLKVCISLAEKMGDKSKTVMCQSLYALRCSNTGMYDESQIILKGINTVGADREALGTYYNACQHVFGELAYYTHLSDMRQYYKTKYVYYRNLMRKTLPPTCDDVLLSKERDFLDDGNLKQSMAINNLWLSKVKRGSHRYALVALYRYLEFKARRDTVEMMQWLAESALSDVRNAVMDQGSLWEIANQLMLRGDVDRSYRYISFTSECTKKFGSRQRSWTITPFLSSIAKNYEHENEVANHKLRMMVMAISILAMMLILLLYYVNKQRKRLSDVRDQLKDKNKELSSVNGQLSDRNNELSSLNEQLSSVNGQLSTLNKRLNESNHVKEEYIGRFMSLCSQYVDKLDDYRKMVNKKMKNKELDELFRLSKSQELKDRELEELYENFDKVFLHLFPNFIDDFNSLLTPEVQIHPKQENRLTTEIRIFALIRLGIEDSGKIAEFLHYSVNTIYNYRARIKNGALGNREHFERIVKELGMPK